MQETEIELLRQPFSCLMYVGIETSMLVLAEFKTFCVKTALLILRICRQLVMAGEQNLYALRM